MTITMNDSRIVSITQIKAFLKVNSGIRFNAVSKEKYDWINEVLNRFRYFRLKKKERGFVRKYIMKMTGMSRSQLTELISRKRKFGKIWYGSARRHKFSSKYWARDIALLVKTDNAHNRLSGPATKDILNREFEKFHKQEYENISQISSSHIYNLREKRQYISHSLTIKKTNAIKVPIGLRKKPDPQNKPGFLRVDTVHQGDLDRKKGIYHINITDEIIQWELVGAVEKISEYYLEPLLKDLINQFPFRIINFHSDNGSEYINKIVAKLLNKLFIQQTKSRARHCNDNALAECKNGAIIRKNMGYVHIPQRFASSVNQFYKQYLNVYLNFHRPSGFATITTDKKGKEKKTYKPNNYMTPYEKLKSLDNPEQYLKQGISFESLDNIAYQVSDNDFAEEMQKAKADLFNNFKHIPFNVMEFTSFVSCRSVD